MIESGKKRRGKNPNDPARFIRKTFVTGDGEIAEKTIYELDPERIREEEMYDGFYAVITNLEEDPAEVIKINHRRWEIEENFRIMKSEFEARPVYVQRDDRIKAHFLTCYISLLVYRLLEKKARRRVYLQSDPRDIEEYADDTAEQRKRLHSFIQKDETD